METLGAIEIMTNDCLVPTTPLDVSPQVPVSDFTSLWTGRYLPDHLSHALNGTVSGYIPTRQARGSCVIISTHPSLWFYVARSLGFTITHAWSQDVTFREAMQWAFPEVEFVPEARMLDTHTTDMVFGDFEGVQTITAELITGYWYWQTCPHLLTRTRTSSIQLPSSWTLHSETFVHSSMGGSTNGTHTLFLCVPLHVPLLSGTLSVLPVQPWTPLESAIDAVTSAPAAPAPHMTVMTTPSVKWSGREVWPCGLFPVEHKSTLVRVRCVFNVTTRWGTRALTPFELATLWDVPILLQDYIRSQGWHTLLERFTHIVPGKTLLLGADFLISSRIRGGLRLSDRIPTKGVPREKKLVVPDQEGKKDYEVGREFGAVLKVEGQKHDDAAVPVHLWDSMFQKERALDTCITHPLPKYWRQGIAALREAILLIWRRRRLREWVRSTRRYQEHNHICTHKSWFRLHVTAQYPMGNWSWSDQGRANYMGWYRTRYSIPYFQLSQLPARDCFHRIANCSWWDWDAGSSLFFWKWPLPYQHWARDGQPHYQVGELPAFTKPQDSAKKESDRVKMKKKLDKVRQRFYIEPGPVTSLSHMFYVPKGLEDIRMVYNAASCGLNDALWAPHFGLPTVQQTIRSLLPEYYQCDMDIGEMFLNFPLHTSLRPYAGVDITHVRGKRGKEEDWEVGRERVWERWSRNFMGMTDSPYRSLQLVIVAKHVAYGDRNDDQNPFQWKLVRLNLPGSPDYDPSLPWVAKYRADGHVASDVYIYADDGRLSGHSEGACWAAAKRLCSTFNSLGIQDSSRKRTGPSRKQGPWAGTVVHTEGEVVATVTDVKWEKTRSLIQELQVMLDQGTAATTRSVPRKRLECIRGYLVYVARTYRWMTPYLKGVHLTIDGWRHDRDREGWKKPLHAKQTRLGVWDHEFWMEEEERGKGRLEEETEKEAPELVVAVPRLWADIKALLRLTDTPHPAIAKCRVSTTAVALYLMGDASGQGFGSGLWDGSGLHYEAANWAIHCKDETSNWKEASNLKFRIEALEAKGKLNNAELFVLSDNSVFEGTFYKGHSNSKKLNDIVLDLRMVEMRTGCIIHIIHIAGTRMKRSGMDGLSRGDLLEGMMAGINPLSFIPLELSADARVDGRITRWISSWWQHKNGRAWGGWPLKRLTPDDWFSLHLVKGPRLWIPPPAAMATVVELFNEDRLVHPYIPHVFAVPRLMTHLWRKALSKDADIMFTVNVGASFWPTSMHEPLIVLIVFPISHASNHRGPWTLRGGCAALEAKNRLETGFKNHTLPGRREFYDLERPLLGVRDIQEEWSGTILLKLLEAARTFPPVSSCMVRGVLPCTPPGSISSPDHAAFSRRRRGKRRPSYGGKVGAEVQDSKRRRSPAGNTL